MRVVVVGASGNIGTSVLAALAGEPEVDSVLGLARRRPDAQFPKTEWAEANVQHDDLEPHFRGADAVVHLAWAIQPSRDLAALRRTNVLGSERVFQAAAAAGVPAVVHGSSVGVYSTGPKDRAVDESWPRDGISTSFYGRHKAEVEKLLDRFETERPGIRVVRLRPGLVFKRDAGEGIRRLFLGPLMPSGLARAGLVPLVPNVPGLRFQAVHSLDVGEAYRLAIVGQARGAFNVAAEPVLDGPALAELLDARAVRVSPGLLRGAAGLTWRLRLQPSPAGWIDLALGVPLMDVSRARSELGWEPRWSAAEAFLDLMQGIRERRGSPTPPLAPESSGPARSREVATGVGQIDNADRGG
ncbi:MAG TPA: NAD-dependent epimerase/dehydratase family protein [Gaiellaceae bacterium]|nr:NAD-dependent epimerase/dehydratase family protein [Gaiellaceae bacterium]